MTKGMPEVSKIMYESLYRMSNGILLITKQQPFSSCTFTKVTAYFSNYDSFASGTLFLGNNKINFTF